ncbi:DUF3857 domain-containing protein [Hymenobacter cellulosivorans]|uniref:DUF3857 domain-containing protein n=1 Tax=Hymenobacter cellulosivorans TaxID=2932249 RepID=A0ABY4FF36_9BACT|nr:DUF3857 domain-containing protein [Hymenobacter cellulosivorans]UOQ55123.1 DUF3857 domain-containing protein [Hymenobacter cellulosivorans]
MSRFLASAATLLLSGGSAVAGGGTPSYPVATLPAALRENAHAVVRNEEQTLVVKSMSRTVETVRRAVTILDEAGADWATLRVYYDQLNTVSYLRGTVYNAAGQAYLQLRPANVRDYGLSDGSTLASDGRARIADLRQPVYPYTVEYEYEVVSNNLLFYPSWHPQREEQLAVEKSSFRVVTPSDLPLRFQEEHLPAGVTAQHTLQGTTDVYQWQLQNLVALDDEPDSPPSTCRPQSC